MLDEDRCEAFRVTRKHTMPACLRFVSSAWLTLATTGISTIEAPTLARVKHHLRPLITFARYKIAHDGGANRPVGLFVGATGGMRALLNQDDDPRKRSIEDTVQQIIRTYNYAVMDKVDYQTISGRVEGVFGWVTANYTGNTNPGNNNPANFATTPEPAQQIGGQAIQGCGYVEMGGQTMQIAFHSGNVNTGIQISIGANFNVAAYCWENRGADATWQKHRDNLYDGSEKPQKRKLGLELHHNATRIDNCLPTRALDRAKPSPTPGDNGYTGSGLFIGGLHECLWLAGGYYPTALGTFEPRAPGFLRNDLPENFRNIARVLKNWMGGATFRHGLRNIISEGAYAPITLLAEAAELQTGDNANYNTRRGNTPEKYFCRTVFDAIYTSVTLHNGFGMKIHSDDTAETNINTVRNALAPVQRGTWLNAGQPPPPLKALLDACVTDNEALGKTYSVIDKPWALGAAVVYAHNSANNYAVFKALVKK